MATAEVRTFAAGDPVPADWFDIKNEVATFSVAVVAVRRGGVLEMRPRGPTKQNLISTISQDPEKDGWVRCSIEPDLLLSTVPFSADRLKELGIR